MDSPSVNKTINKPLLNNKKNKQGLDWEVSDVYAAVLNSALISLSGALFCRFNFAFKQSTFKTKNGNMSWNKRNFIHLILLCFSYHSPPALFLSILPFLSIVASSVAKGVHTSTPPPSVPSIFVLTGSRASLITSPVPLTPHIVPSLHPSSPLASKLQHQ